MSAPMAKADTLIRIKGDLVSKPYIDITLHIMAQFGVTVENRDYQEFFLSRLDRLTKRRVIFWSKAMHRRLPIFWRLQHQRR